jgi:integrase
MPRMVRDANLETRSARARLKVGRKTYFRMIEPGLHLAYRKEKANAPGVWSVRRYKGTGQGYKLEVLRTRDGKLAMADDFAEADGLMVLNFAQAQTAARGQSPSAEYALKHKAQTVKEAIEEYRADLIQRDSDPANADRALCHMPEELQTTEVMRLTRSSFRDFTKALAAADIAASTYNRITTAVKAALNLARKGDERIENAPWETALETKKGATQARNVVLPPKDIWGIVDKCYEHNPQLGILAEALAITGARPVQLGRLKVKDLDASRASPSLSMPSTKKGKGNKVITYANVPLPFDFAVRLRNGCKDKKPNDPLFTRADGGPWNKSCHNRPFEEAVAAYDKTMLEGDDKVTAYAFRHSAIVRDLLAGIPARVVAANHDTSLAMLEKHYSRWIRCFAPRGKQSLGRSAWSASSKPSRRSGPSGRTAAYRAARRELEKPLLHGP